MQALCHEALGNKKEALEAWQALWSRSKSASHAVRVAGLQFDAKLLAEAEATITTALAAADAATTMIKLPKTREEMQNTPAAAALHNLRALVILTRDPQNRQAARQELEKALEISPDYEIAKRNLAGLDEAKPPATE
ncbi:MAG: hypothetical protein MUF31_05325 [Akkermansiaceae bacterium]|nr:hypothetical protein [Akkermansiaceae bacterium]